MLVPRTRLIVWAALLALPFAAVGSTVPGALPISVIAIGGFVALAIADAALAPGRLAGIRVQLPEFQRLQKNRAGALEVLVHNESAVSRPLRIGLAFPHEVDADAIHRLVTLPQDAALSRVEWTIVPTERGQFFIRRAHLEGVSALGFWSVRRAQEISCELRVYPNLMDERRHVAALFLRRAQLGVHAQRNAGQGREFEKLRNYVHGDSLADIHWKASAKRNEPVTKVFQVERTHEVYVIIDASRLSARRVHMEGAAPAGDGGAAASPTTLERYVTAALILGLAAEQQGDQFGLITFSDRVLSFVRARNGQAHYDACRDRLYTLQPQSVSPDYEELCSFIRLRLRKRALLIFLTALDDPVLAEEFTAGMDLICRQHLVLVNMLQPPGARPLFDDPAQVTEADDLYRCLGGHLRWHSLRELQKVLQRRGVRMSLLAPEKIAADLIAQHAEVRARQLL